MNRRLRFGVLLFCCALFVQACSGSGSSPSTPSVGSGATPSGGTVPLTTTNVPVSLPPVSSYTESIIIPANDAPAGSSMVIGESLALPSGIPAPTSLGAKTSIMSISATTSANVTFNASPGFTVQFPDSVNLNGIAVKLAAYDPNTGWSDLATGSISNHTVTLASSSHTLTFSKGQARVFSVYSPQLIIGCPTPTPGPTPLGVKVYITSAQSMDTGVTRTSVTVYDEEGHQVYSPGGFPNLTYANYIAFDGNNQRLYVTNAPFFGDSSITVYDKNGYQIMTSGPFGDMLEARGIVFDPHNRYLYLANTLDMNVYDEEGNEVMPQVPLPQGTNASGIAFVPSSNLLYYTNTVGAQNVRVVNEAVAPVQVSGPFAGLVNSYSIAYDDANGHLYATSANTDQVIAFDQQGNTVPTPGGFPGLSNPQAIAYDPHTQHFYVADYDGHVWVFDANGYRVNVSGTFPNLIYPHGIAVVP